MFNGFTIDKKYLVLMLMCGFFVCLDQVTKLWVHSNFVLSEERIIIPSFFSFTYVRNFGASFGILSDAHPTFRKFFFLGLTPVALGVILYLIRQLKPDDKIGLYALCSVFAGALGNYIDRLRFGYVIDFLDFYLVRGALFGFPKEQSYHWPAFNVADMCIVVGVTVILLTEWLRTTGKPKNASTP